MHFLAYFGL